jgi:integrase
VPTGLQKGLERIVEKSKVDFRVHDLRRTVGTGLGGMDIGRTTIKKLFNHSERSDVTAIYDRHRYDSQKSAALLKWDGQLHEVVTGKIGRGGEGGCS